MNIISILKHIANNNIKYETLFKSLTYPDDLIYKDNTLYFKDEFEELHELKVSDITDLIYDNVKFIKVD